VRSGVALESKHATHYEQAPQTGGMELIRSSQNSAFCNLHSAI